jgi:hypothetical protein
VNEPPTRSIQTSRRLRSAYATVSRCAKDRSGMGNRTSRISSSLAWWQMNDEINRVAPGRRCGECSLCCKLLSVEALNKPAGRWCEHCLKSSGCSIYDRRPTQCERFHCGWLSNSNFGDEWYPRRSKMVVFAAGYENRLGIHVDPASPGAWRREPYFSQLKQLACDAVERQDQVVVYLSRTFPIGQLSA